MTKLIIKSIIYGFIVGTAFFAIAPFGLGVYFIEFLKPVLIPGVLLTQLILGNTVGSITLILALFLNGLIYTVLFLSFALTRKYVF